MKKSKAMGVLAAVLALGLGTAWASGSAGTLDATFGSGGAQVVRTLPTDLYEMDSRYVACRTVGGTAYTVFVRRVGSSTTGTGWGITRHLADGSLDNGFGTSGEVVLFGGAGLSEPGSAIVDSNHFTHAVAIAPDGKTLVLGRRYESGRGKKVNAASVLVRLDTDGTFDETFGSDGIVDVGVLDVCALALDESTSGYDIVVAGTDRLTTTSGGGGKGKKGGGSTSTSLGLVVMRYDDDGALLHGFSDDFGDDQDVRSIDLVLDTSGRIVVQNSRDGGRVLSRYDDVGDLDTSFGDAGRQVVEDGDGYPMSRAYIGVDAADRVVVSGWSTGPATVLRRYDDALDEDLTLPNDWTFYEAQAGPVAVDGQGRLLVSLWVGTAADWDVTVARYTSAGALDASFGTGGVAAVFDDGSRDRPGPLAVDGQDRVVGSLVGTDAGPPYYARDVLVRWLGD